MNDESTHPHAPDVLERQAADQGFSAGWGLHMQPSVRYWLDSHTHMTETTGEDVGRAVAQWHDFMWAHRLRRHVAVDGFPEHWEALAAVARRDDRFLWHCRMQPTSPNIDHLRRCKDAGAVGLKLHNAPIMAGDIKPAFLLSDAWHRVYHEAGKLGMPVLWHVTQRLTECPYTGGGRDSYWKIGHPKGVRFTNQNLLDIFLEIVAGHRGANFIGAHFLHMGPARVSSLLQAHPNLFTDTSIGGFVAMHDDMYESDRAIYRDFVLRHPERILFGTDVVLNRQSAGTEMLRQHFFGHVRWVRQLRLPQEVLSKVAHENFERLAGLQPVAPLPWGALRP